ncbi:MAG: DUF1553 domain-containing protein [Pirellulales bacterium]|nr:DUF1553 domain-containing protein [Pirellulales bacterium]
MKTVSRLYRVSLVLRPALCAAAIVLGSLTGLRAAEPAATDAQTPATERIDYAAQIQPLLAAHCYKCHGPQKQESGLRLDQKAAALNHPEAVYGPAIVPGKSAESVLIQAVSGTHADLERMPPGSEPLSEAQIALLKGWIDQGATWPDDPQAALIDRAKHHWAFQAPVRPEPPAVQRGDWARGELDQFVLARLESEGLAPSPEADRTTLLRRLSLDLIGLPPTIAEVDAFVADSRPDAYEMQVERLLASPHYGERWGRHWLDAARYADSDGYEKDKSRNVWFFRDWVVGAFNRDLPYDQFIIEQLAGDQLPDATQDQIVATGFLRNSMLNEEGGVDPEQFRMDAMFDRMDCIGKSILGLTIQCGQCHSHKYDPFSQEEYYRLFAFLNNDHEPTQVVYTADELQQIAGLTSDMRSIENSLRERVGDWETQLDAWAAETAAADVDWTVLAPQDYSELGGGAKLSLLADQSMLCAGYAPTHCTFQVTGDVPLLRVTGVRLETLRNPNLPCGGPGRSFKGTFGLTEIKVEVIDAAAPDQRREVKLAAAVADYNQPESPLEPNFDDRSGKSRVVGPVGMAIDGNNETAWGIDAGPGRRNQDRVAVFQFAEPVDLPAGGQIVVKLVQNHGGWNSDDHQNNLLGCFRVSITSAADPASRVLPLAVSEALHTPQARRSPTQAAALFSYWRTQTPQFEDANHQIESLWQQWPAGATSLVLQTRPEARMTRMLTRGDFLRPGKPVDAGVPAFLHALPDDAPPTRLTLARWLVDRRSPTTARVFVNRVWQAYFGTGLVSTPEDFGVQGERPSHPELLDWLACEFMDRGWSIKQLHRTIVSSATYRQASRVTPELREKDPFNRLLARASRVRAEGEIVHDIALAASGLLNPAQGGPSVYPPLPTSVLALSYGPMTWNSETGANRYRRALYTFRRRSIPFPALQNFDTPNGDFSCVRRTRSNTPLQALTTLNETIFIEAAQALARQTLVAGGSDDAQRITYAFRRCVSRAPESGELNMLLTLLERQERRIADGWANPWLIATGSDHRPDDLPPGATPTRLGAYTVVARVLLNLDETITRE